MNKHIRYLNQNLFSNPKSNRNIYELKKKVRKIRTTDAITMKEIFCAMVKDKALCVLSVARKLP